MDGSKQAPQTTLIRLDGLFSTAFAVILTLRLLSLINFIYTGRGVKLLGLQEDFEALKVT